MDTAEQGKPNFSPICWLSATVQVCQLSQQRPKNPVILVRKLKFYGCPQSNTTIKSRPQYSHLNPAFSPKYADLADHIFVLTNSRTIFELE